MRWTQCSRLPFPTHSTSSLITAPNMASMACTLSVVGLPTIRSSGFPLRNAPIAFVALGSFSFLIRPDLPERDFGPASFRVRASSSRIMGVRRSVMRRQSTLGEGMPPIGVFAEVLCSMGPTKFAPNGCNRILPTCIRQTSQGVGKVLYKTLLLSLVLLYPSRLATSARFRLLVNSEQDLGDPR